jgi:hypothetical protein
MAAPINIVNVTGTRAGLRRYTLLGVIGTHWRFSARGNWRDEYLVLPP